MKREGPATAFLMPCTQQGPKLDKLKLQASNDVSALVWETRLTRLFQNNYQYQAAKLNVGVMGGGRWYHEVTVDAGSQQQCSFGFALADVATGGPLGQNELSWGWDGVQRQWAGKSEAFGDGLKQVTGKTESRAVSDSGRNRATCWASRWTSTCARSL